MANGDVKQTCREFRIIALQDGTGATSSGTWVETGPYGANGMLHVSGITTATVQIYGSNADTKPADATDGTKIGDDITADAISALSNIPKFLKAKISAWTEGTLYVHVKLHRSAG